MAKIVRRTYTAAEKAAYVAEFERLYRAGDRTYASIGRQLGVSESNYYAWVAQGIKPTPAATKAAPAAKPATPGKPRVIYTPAERERLVIDVERLLAAGQIVEAACRAVGIGEKSFRTWRAARRAAPLPMPAMRPVEVTAPAPEVTALVPVAIDAPASLFEPVSPTAPPRPAPEPPGLSLVAPGGYRLEGLAVETAVAVLRALAC